MVDSREKGKRYERELAAILRAAGYPDAHRTAQYQGNSGKAYDIEGVPGIAIEAKHREKMALYDWIAQAVRDSEGSGLLPVVMHRRNNAETLVTMRLPDFLEVFREYSQKDAVDEWCMTCKEFDMESHSCPRWNRVIKSTLDEMRGAEERTHGRWIFKSLDNFRKYEVVCSKCGARYVGNYDAYDEPCDFLYCPQCGEIKDTEAEE